MRLPIPALLVLGLLAGCGPAADSGSESPGDVPGATGAPTGSPVGALPQDPVRNARGTEYMVAAPTVGAMEAGRTILEQGGNAVDAAAAAAFALWVTDPMMSSVGGRAQILLRMADGATVGIDGATQAPLRVGQPALVGHGYGTVPIPGGPAALEQMLEDYGTLSMREVMQPAIRLAEEGFAVQPDLAAYLETARDPLTDYAGTRAHFYKPDGSGYAEGEIFRQPALAQTLRTLADEGADALYRGSLADAFVADMEANGGLVRHDDLEQYRPLPGPVVRGSYRGHEIVARGGNCDGASVIETLQMLEHFDLTSMDNQSPEYIHTVAQAIYIAGTDEYVPDWMQVAKAHAARRVLEIDPRRALPTPVQGGGPGGDTNHLSVVDADGNAVAITQSIGPNFGSKVASPTLGFFYAYSYDMNDEPSNGRRPASPPPWFWTKESPTWSWAQPGAGAFPGPSSALWSTWWITACLWKRPWRPGGGSSPVTSFVSKPPASRRKR